MFDDIFHLRTTIFFFLLALNSDTVELVINIDDANDNIPVFSPNSYVGGLLIMLKIL